MSGIVPHNDSILPLKITVVIYIYYNVFNIIFRRKKMNRTELVDAMAKKMGNSVTKKEVESALKSFVDVVTEELTNKGKIQLVGFGTFETSVRPEREVRNPRTGETMKVAESVVAKFKPGKALKDAVNN